MKYYRSHRLKNHSLRWALTIGLVLLVVIIATATFVFFQRKQSTDLTDATTVKARAGVLYLLPTNEEPALATVTDNSKLSSSFAGKVENGDKILIYEKNKKAIVYRPSINKIVEVEPIQIDSVDSLKTTK